MAPLHSDGADMVRRALRTAADVVSACPWCTDRHAMGPVRAVRAVLELLERDDAHEVSAREVCGVLAEAFDDAGPEAGTALLRWGPWALDFPTLVLRCATPDAPHVRLAQCTDPGATLDQLLRVVRAPWADAVAVAGLARALDDLLRPPGASWFRSPRQIERLVAECIDG